MKADILKEFYTQWSKKSPEEIDFDIKVSIEKSGAALEMFKKADIGTIDSILEIGCGYGRNLAEVMGYTNAIFGLGCDISEDAIAYARQQCKDDSIKYICIPSMDIRTTVSHIRSLYNTPFDLVILFDILEHVPNTKTFVQELASIAKCFIIILPLEDCILFNYIFPERMKEYPSAKHKDGHLWEFHVNNVHHFVVSLGLTPIMYNFYKYNVNTIFPPHLRPHNLKGRLFYEALRKIHQVSSYLLPKRVFLRVMGGGGFVCLATWSGDLVLE